MVNRKNGANLTKLVITYSIFIFAENKQARDNYSLIIGTTFYNSVYNQEIKCIITGGKTYFSNIFRRIVILNFWYTLIL